MPREYLIFKFHDISHNGTLLKRADHLTGHSFSKAKSNRVRTGIAAVYGNVDAVDDIVQPTAFDDAIADFNKGIRPRFLFNHRSNDVPIGRIVAMKSIGMSELPASIRAGGGTGGLVVQKDYFKNSLADAVLEAADAGEMAMSFMYEILDSQYSEQNGTKVRLLKKLKLFEVSDVTFPCNHLATAVISKQWPPKMETFRHRALRNRSQSDQIRDLQIFALKNFLDDINRPSHQRHNLSTNSGRRAAVAEVQRAVASLNRR